MRKKLIASIMIALCFYLMIPQEVQAGAANGIYNNGLGGIYIDINSSPYTDFAKKPYGQYAYGTQGCAWFASARAYQLTGIGNTIWSGESFWYNQYNLFGYGRGSTPRSKALACYSNHVAVVEAVSGNSILISEGGSTSTSSSNGYCRITWITAPTVGTTYETVGKFYGYVYLNAETSTPVNVGDDFYAYIIKSDTWNHLGAVDGNVEIVNQNTVTDGSDGWHFVRQSDGSYYIYNWMDKNVLTASGSGTADGTNVITSAYTGSSNQRWYVYGTENGNYRLRPAYTSKVLDVSNGSSNEGTNVQLWTSNGTGAQKYNLYRIDCVGASKSISVTRGTSASATKIVWERGEYATGYNLYLKSVSSTGSTSTYKTIKGLTDTEYSIVLPAGKYTVTIESYNQDYTKTSGAIAFTINNAKPTVTVSVEKSSYTYTGSAIKPAVTVYFDGTKTSSSNYTVSYKNNIEVGTATVTITATSAYSNATASATFKITNPTSFSSVSLSKTSYTYSGSAQKPSVSVYYNNTKLSSSDYSVSYKNNVNVGTATVTVTGKGTFSKCSSELTFKITPKAFTSVKLSKTSYTYTGKVLKPTVSVYSGKTKLASKYYTVSYTNNKNVGTATVTITGKGKYSNYKSTTTFKITPKAFTKVTLSKTSYAYNGNARKPSVTVYVGTKKLSSSKYTVSYNNNTSIGKATVTITGKGDYANYKSTKTFKIVPAKQVITSISTNGKSGRLYVTHTYDGLSTGYKVQVSTNKSFGNIVSKSTFGNNVTSWHTYNLSSNKTYYVRVRSYKTIDGTNYYGAWSAVKSIKTK